MSSLFVDYSYRHASREAFTARKVFATSLVTATKVLRKPVLPPWVGQNGKERRA